MPRGPPRTARVFVGTRVRFTRVVPAYRAVAWWPGRIKPGTSTNETSITLDVMPTILSVAGIAPPKNRPLDGLDLSPVLFEQKPLSARPLYWANLNNNGSRSEALREGPWKLVVQHPRAKPGRFGRPGGLRSCFSEELPGDSQGPSRGIISSPNVCGGFTAVQ